MAHPAAQFRRLACIIALVLVTFAGSAQTTQAQSYAGCQFYHIVAPGENLFRIGLQYGLGWTTIAQVNGIYNANLVYAGQRLCIPFGGNVTPLPTAAPTAAATGSATAPATAPATTSATAPATASATATATVLPPVGGVVLPPAGVYPTINFDRRSAAPGDTITITGVNFPTNEPVDILITPLYSFQPYTPVAASTTASDGTLATAFSLPIAVNGVPLRGYAFSIMVKGKQTGYFGFNFIYNTHP